MNDHRIRSIVFVALFTALTVIGTMIKIPLPTGAFVHLGNAVLLLAVLLLGYVKGSLAGGLGFAIFDLLNGYATEAPYFILESFIVGAFAYGASNMAVSGYWVCYWLGETCYDANQKYCYALVSWQQLVRSLVGSGHQIAGNSHQCSGHDFDCRYCLFSVKSSNPTCD